MGGGWWRGVSGGECGWGESGRPANTKIAYFSGHYISWMHSWHDNPQQHSQSVESCGDFRCQRPSPSSPFPLPMNCQRHSRLALGAPMISFSIPAPDAIRAVPSVVAGSQINRCVQNSYQLRCRLRSSKMKSVWNSRDSVPTISLDRSCCRWEHFVISEADYQT